jgi:YHS domain-containing protein
VSVTLRRCPICKKALGSDAIDIRYEMRIYSFDTNACKRIFQENPDRYLDAGGGVLPEPR